MMTRAAPAGPDHVPEHWRWRPDWEPGRACLWWYLTFGDQPQVAALSRQVTESLGKSSYVEVIPPRWLHMTLREVGFVDEVLPYAIEEHVEQTCQELSTRNPFALTVGPVGTLPGAVVLGAQPAERVEDLREQLAGRPHTEPGLGFSVADDMTPHVSVAYVRRACDSAEVLREVPAVTPVTVTASHVTLAAVTRSKQHYEWDVRAIVPLGPGAGTPAPGEG